MLLLSCDLPASVMARIMPFLWPHGIVKDAHSGIIWICILLCTVNLEPLLFSHTVFIYVIVGKYAIWMQPFFRRNRWMKEWLFQSFWDFINLLGRCTDCQFLPWGGDLHHLMDLVSFWTSYIVRKKTTTLPKKLPAESELAFPRIWLTFFFFSVCWLTGNHSYFPALRSPTNLDEPNFRCPDAYNSLLSVSWPSQKKTQRHKKSEEGVKLSDLSWLFF